MEFSIANTINTLTNVLLIISIFFAFGKIKQQHFIVKLLIILIVTLLVIDVPMYDGVSLNWLLNGITGGLSISLLCILALFVGTRLYNWGDFELVSVPLALAVVISGFALYLSTFGLISFYIYGLGYLPSFVLIPLGLAIIYIWNKNKLNGLILLLGTLCFAFKVLHSKNLLDYLIDPVFWGICLVRVYSEFKKNKA